MLPIQQVWQSTAPSGCILNWIHVEIKDNEAPQPNAAEVEDWQWMTAEEMTLNPETLKSNIEFLRAWQRGDFKLAY